MSEFATFESLALNAGLKFERENPSSDSQEPTVRVYSFQNGATKIEARINTWNSPDQSNFSVQRFVDGRHKEKFFVESDAKSIDVAKKRLAKLIAKASK